MGPSRVGPSPGPDDLIARVRRRDAEALAALFSRHRERLARGIRFRLDPRLHRRMDVEDILQEVFLGASQRIASFRGDSETSFFVWLRRIAGQTLIDLHRRHIRAQARDAGREVSLDDPRFPAGATTSLAASLESDRTSTSQAMIQAETYSRLERAIGCMEPIDREVLTLRHFEELTNGEVAEVLGIAPKAASLRYKRALARLKTILVKLSDFNGKERVREARRGAPREGGQAGGKR